MYHSQTQHNKYITNLYSVAVVHVAEAEAPAVAEPPLDLLAQLNQAVS